MQLPIVLKWLRWYNQESGILVYGRNFKILIDADKSDCLSLMRTKGNSTGQLETGSPDTEGLQKTNGNLHHLHTRHKSS